MNEVDFENHFYQCDLPELLASPLFLEVDRRKCGFLVRHGMNSGGVRVLSLGSGDGRKEAGIAAHAAEILGIDICPVAVQQAEARRDRLELRNVIFRREDALQLEFEPGSFDLIIVIGMFHHFDDDSICAVLRKSLFWLKPGGVCITNDPQDRRLVSVLRPFVKSRYHKYHSEHEHELNVERVRGHFVDAGFEPVDVRYTDFFLDPLAWVFPRFPRALVGPACALDSFLLSLPGIRQLASHFSVVARKRG